MKRTKAPQETPAQAITRLHNELYSLFDKGLDKAIQIGELLIQQKRALPHGEWIPWIQENLPFSDQTARNYIRLYLNRNELKSKNVLDLTTAYKALQQPKKTERIPMIKYFRKPEPEDLAGYYLFLLKLGYKPGEAAMKMAYGDEDSKAEIPIKLLNRFLDPEIPKFGCHAEDEQYVDYMESLYSAQMRIDVNRWFARIYNKAAEYADQSNHKELKKEFQVISNHYVDQVTKDMTKHGNIPFLNLYCGFLDAVDADKETKIGFGLGLAAMFEDEFLEAIGQERSRPISPGMDINQKIEFYHNDAIQQR